MSRSPIRAFGDDRDRMGIVKRGLKLFEFFGEGNSVNHNTRPWGSYEILHKGPNYQVKRIEVSPQLRFSLQKHMKRAEKWIVISGTGVATVGKKEIPVKRGSVAEIAIEEVHRMHNTGNEALVFIEVQFGEYLGEDDIIRLEDDFNRAKNH